MEEDRTAAPGDVLLGKYRVDRQLGRGGMGVVLSATHVALDERVAIKMLRPSAMKNDVWVARFMREARAAAKIRSEHAVRVHDVGRLENGTPYMVMEHLEGTDAGKWIKDNGPMPMSLAAELMMQACEALAVAHQRGIVHRDIKPSNLFIVEREDGTPGLKVIDFGISKVLPEPTDDTQSIEDAQGMTKSQTVIGTPYFMAPEQMRSSKHVDHRADVWSLGASLHRMLTGKVPFRGSSMMGIFESILAGYDGVEDAPDDVDRLLRECLEPDADLRVQNVAIIAERLAPHAPERVRHLVPRIAKIVGRQRSATDPVPLSEATPTPLSESRPALPATASHEPESEHRSDELVASAAETQTAWAETPYPSHRTRWLGAIVLLAIGGLAAFFVLRPEAPRRDAPSQGASTSAAAVTPLPPQAEATATVTEEDPPAPPTAASAVPTAIATSTGSAPPPRRATTQRGAPPAPTPAPAPTAKPDLWDQPF